MKALTDISFDVREHEVRAIIGPNGAGKSSMLNCINGVYTPQEGLDHLPRPDLQPHELAPGGRDGHRAHLPEPGAVQGHERARQHHDRPQPEDEEQPFQQAIRWGPAEREEIAHREFVERIIDFLEIQAYRKTPVGRLPYGLQSASTWAARWPWSRRCCCSTSRWPA